MRLAFVFNDGVAMSGDVDISLANYLPTRSDENTKDCTADMTLTYRGHVASDAIIYSAGKTEDGNFVVRWEGSGDWGRNAYLRWCVNAGIQPQSGIERMSREAAQRSIEKMNHPTQYADPNWSQWDGR